MPKPGVRLPPPPLVPPNPVPNVWLPELHDDPEGQIYLEVFTRQLGAAEQVSGFKAHHPEKTKEIEKTISALKQMKAAKKPFTLIIRDKSGQSAILEEKSKKL